VIPSGLLVTALALLQLPSAPPLASASPSVGDLPFHPAELLRPEGGAEFVLFQAGPPEVVAIRVSVPLVGVLDPEGISEILQLQAQERMRGLAARIGAQAEVRRTPHALVYQISGMSADLDFLAWILREGMRLPNSAEFDESRRKLQAEIDRHLETPQGVLATRLRSTLSPGSSPLESAGATLSRLDLGHLRDFRARTHRRDRLRIAVAGALPAETILAALAELGEIGPMAGTEAPPPQSTGVSRSSPQINRFWVVLAFPIPAGRHASALVGARWTAEVLRSLAGDFEVGIEVWEVGRERSLILSAAAYPRSRQALENRLRSVFADALLRLDQSAVDRIAGGLRSEILLAGRTPWGLVELVGQAWDAGDGPAGLEALLLELERLQLGDVQLLLEELGALTPIREELRP